MMDMSSDGCLTSLPHVSYTRPSTPTPSTPTALQPTCARFASPTPPPSSQSTSRRSSLDARLQCSADGHHPGHPGHPGHPFSPGQTAFTPFSGDPLSLLPKKQEWEYAKRREMQEIVAGVFLGSYASAKKDQLDNLKAAGVTHIVCVRQRCEAMFVKPNFLGHFAYLVLDVVDGCTENIIKHFARVNAFAAQAIDGGGKVLFHGQTGISRSGALVTAFIMSRFCMTFVDALQLVQKGRFCVCPNVGFATQLQAYEAIYRAQQMVAARGNVAPRQGKRQHRNEDHDDVDDDDDGVYAAHRGQGQPGCGIGGIPPVAFESHTGFAPAIHHPHPHYCAGQHQSRQNSSSLIQYNAGVGGGYGSHGTVDSRVRKHRRSLADGEPEAMCEIE